MRRENILIAVLMLILASFAHAQFNSGSTGSDGALDLSTMTCPGNICELQLPPSGVFNFTTINVPAGRYLRFPRNSRNTPVIMLAQGDVTISGSINVDSGGWVPCAGGNGRCFDYRLGGPGGFPAGLAGNNGFGPGGGIVNGDQAKWIGPLTLVPIIGGSGGASGGYGGAGAIVIASSGSINQTGEIRASAGGLSCSQLGSGGAIRLVANTIMSSGSYYAPGGGCTFPTASGSGIIRIEATNLTFTGSSNPSAILSPINPNVVSGALPQLTIASVGGYAVPSYAGTRFDAVDMILPNSLPDPVNVVIQGANIPSGTVVQLGFMAGTGSSTTCTLTGGPGPVACIATVSNLNRGGVTYLLATAAFDPPGGTAQYNPKGPEKVAKIKVTASLGGRPNYVFLRKDNSVVEITKLPREFLQYFGL